MTEKQRLLYYLQQQLAGKLTPEERETFLQMLNGPEGEALLSEMEYQMAKAAEDPSYLPEEIEKWQFEQIVAADKPRQSQSSVENQEDGLVVATGRVRFLRRWGWAAAAVLLMAAVGIYRWSNNPKATPPVASVQPREIMPGKEGAILTLADNTQVSLDTMKNGVVALQGGATARIVNGTLIYEAAGDEIVYNTMSTPKGRQFHMTLMDGTKIWLNAASSIRFPTVFAGNERRVEITGEVYFEVMRNKKLPFRVNVNELTEVEVLGTQFNVNAYNEEAKIKTTLIEGAVKVQAGNSPKTIAGAAEQKRAIVLTPGQQAQIQKTSSGIVKVIDNVDIDKVMAWKNGLFDFNDLAFDDAMRQLERWYDIEVVYEKGTPPNIELSGKITKDVTLNDLLYVLEKIGVRCRLEDRRLLVSQ